MKIYLDHSAIGLLYEIKTHSLSGGPQEKGLDAKALSELMKMSGIKKVASEDSACEVTSVIKKRRMGESERRQFVEVLDRREFVSLQHRSRFGDRPRFGHGVTFGGPYPEVKDKIKALLVRLSGSTDPEEHEYDARELANCYKKTDIDYFVTIDYRTILAFRKEIQKSFGVEVISPNDLRQILKSRLN